LNKVVKNKNAYSEKYRKVFTDSIEPEQN